MFSAESRDGSPGRAPVYRHPPLVALPWSQPALPASLPYRGVRRAGVKLESRRPQWPSFTAVAHLFL